MCLSSVRIKICDIGNTGTLVDAEIFEGDGAFIEGVNAGDKLAVESIGECLSFTLKVSVRVKSGVSAYWSVFKLQN
ncbi:hypothetical protein FSHL1_009149 [Fusarium sambucinum]